MKDEFFLRDDILDFSSKLDSQSFNIKAYRKRNRSSKKHQNQKLLQSTEVLTDFGRVQHSQRTHATNDVLSARRLSATAAVRKRPRAGEKEFPGFTKTARTKHNSMIEEMMPFQQPKDRTIVNHKGPQLSPPPPPPVLKHGSFSQHQRQFAKGGLKNKHLENWLNQILLEYCHQQKFDSTIEHPALKKYGIDKNSLLSKGIDPCNLQRIYKSLFVYSMGFNTLLREIGSRNMNLRKTFWKVYAILLEYCSDGDFDTMIGQIERDKLRKMEVLKEEIERRQELIDNNEDIHQERNAKIFKQLKLLRDQNQDLQNDKNVLMEDYKQAEQAFNEQVSLRLKFQNKINEIHGVHRQLAIKHQKLYDDLQGKNFQNINLREKFTRLTQQYLTAKTDNEFLKKENAALKQENEFNYGLMDDMKKKTTGHQLLQVEWRHKKQEFAIALRERDKRVEQVKGQLKNAELMLQMKEKSQHQLQKQYKRALQQNKQLVTSLQKELEQINNFMLQKKDFNDTHSRLYAQVEVANRHLNEKALLLQEQKQQIESLNEQIRNKDTDIEILTGKNKQHEIDMNDLYSKISEMKKIKTVIEEELTEARAREEYYKNYYIQKEKAIAALTLKVEEDERTISQFNIARRSLQSKVNLLTQKLSAQQENNKKKMDKLRDQVRILDKQNKALKVELQQKLNEVERATLLYEDTFNKLKDQLFERNDLQLRYNQSLSVVQSETDHIKKLNIRISQLQERTEDLVRKLKGAEFVLQNREKAFKNQLQSHGANSAHLKEQLRLKKTYVHPMKYEDALSQLKRISEQKQMDRVAAEAEKKRLNVPALQVKIQHLQADLFELRISHQEQINRKDQELQIEREKLRQLQEKQKTPTQDGIEGSGEATAKSYFKQKQRKYLQIIRQKTTQLDDLLNQVQSMHDQNNKLISRIGDIELQSKLKDSKLQAFQSQFSQLESQRHALNMEKTNVFKQKEKLLAQMTEQESRMMDPQDNKNFLGVPSSNRQIQSRQRSSRLENPSRESQSREKATQPGWRNDFGKKVKNAYNYYKK